ncbi:ABC transporter permease [Pseudoalteromonas sp. NBT06-2]|uniref:ABC transporter permease n=1 Tax=Pseudoalteromonas sp. NBT06-2 TaxID=2025950 RepID=UPI000BA71AC9|nr:FtsX-like permease family protein [Pseudoalteromonas sp. NBT06-2]PAJ74430.1 ABC transporter permease [Pseudoalteromonas sp. NBT06-2]
MSLYQRAFISGIARIFSLPRLSIPLIVTLGLTLGAVLSVIAISSTLFFKPLKGVNNEDNIQTFQFQMQFSKDMSISYWNLRRLADFNETYKHLGTWAGISSNNEEAVSINNVTYSTTQFSASDTILSVLGTQLLKGQDVTIEAPDEYVWISNTLWQQVFSGSDSAIGKQLSHNNKNYIIAGIIEDLMDAPDNNAIASEQIWFISKLSNLLGKTEEGAVRDDIKALLLKTSNPNVQLPSKTELIKWRTQYITNNTPEEEVQGYLGFINNSPVELITDSYRNHLLGSSKNLVYALFAAVIGLLLMATLNLLNLFIAHYQTRNKEFAIQLSLGSSLLKLRLLILLENLPSFILATISGLLVTGWIIKSLPHITNNNLPMIDDISINNTTLFASFLIIVLLSILFSAFALIDINKQALANNLNSSGKGIQAQTNHWLSRTLMVIQLTVASVLLTASVMIASQSYDAVYRDLGFELGNHYEVSMSVSDPLWAKKIANPTKYQGSEAQKVNQDISNIIETNVTDSKVVIPTGAPLTSMYILMAYSPENNPNKQILFQPSYLSVGYFKAFDIPVLAGANLSQAQIDNNDNGVVIDTIMAKELFPNLSFQEVIGKSIDLGIEDDKGESIKSTINAVVGSIQSQIGRVNPIVTPRVYFSQFNISGNFAFTVNLPAGESMTAEQIQTQITKQYPMLNNLQVTSLKERWNEQTLSERLSFWLVLMMTGLTLFLAAIGIAGLTQMTTNQKKYELAVRMATGAKQSRLLSFILKDAFWMLSLGLGLGFIICVFGYQQLQTSLTLLPEFNWLAMTTLNICLIIIVLLSVTVPAWRVISSDPMHALREE